MSIGKVIQVIGPVVDVEFPPGKLPNIYNAIKVTQEENKATGKPAVNITLEAALHLGENRVRGIAMSTSITSGIWSRSCSTASTPSLASNTSMPRFSK